MILLYSATLFLSAALLFLVEPMMGKVLLPVLGGAPEVWIATQLFFQMALLAGYAYGHAIGVRLPSRRQAGLHLALLVLGLLLVPIGVHPGGSGGIGHPVLWVLGLLTVTVGLPFLLVSANGPLLQRWISGARHRAAADPYFLYAASNLGSMIGLVAYPLVVEPQLSLETQARLWAWGYRAMALLVCACAVAVWRSRRRGGGVAGDGGDAVGGGPAVLGGEATLGNLAAGVEPARGGTVLGNPAAGDDPARGGTARGSTAGDAADDPARGDTALGNLAAGDAAIAEPPAALTWPRRARWLALAAVPSSFMLGTTTFITRDLAPVPLLWVIPLALYLGSLVVAFAPNANPRRLVRVTRLVLPAVVIALVYTMSIGSQRPLWFLLPLHLLGLLVAALMCHAALADDRPAVSHLTEFYLWVALGGALGGVFNALIAPTVFTSLVEYPVAIVAVCLLRPVAAGSRPGILDMLGADPRLGRLVDLTVPALLGLALAAALRATAASGSDTLSRRSVIIGFAAGLSVNFARRPMRFATAVAVIFLATSAAVVGGGPSVLARDRTFFGIYEVTSDDAGYHTLFDGTTLHGVERIGRAGPPTPLSYYNPSGPVGQIFAGLSDPTLADRTAVVGLGTGAMACYSRPGERWTFYEIDPAVARIAENPRLFTYLRDCPGRFRVVVGDARRSLVRDRGARYGIIALDAFSSDAIPVHLLTREALAVYLERLTPHGLLLFHISNRYLDLRPELGGLAAGQDLTCRVEHNLVSSAQASLRYAESTWVAMARRPQDLGRAAADPRWKPCPGRVGQAWSDDHSSLLGLLKWG